MTDPAPPDASEGDVNLSACRRAWERTHLAAGTRAVLDEDARWFLHQSMSTPCLNALAGAQGIWITDLEGRRYMDFHGNSVHQVGYGHPAVLAAVRDALDALPFSPRRYTNRAAVALARELAERAPMRPAKLLFAPGGTAAIGMALKLARIATGRHKTVSMWDSFHGASLDAISVGGEAVFRRGIGPLLPGTEHVPPCDPRGCPLGCGGRCDLRCAEYVEYVLDREQDVAAVVVETIRCTDVQVPPPDYYRILRRACDRHGALLVLDEIPIGLGRTGKLFAAEHYGVEPDMVVLGKGLGGGVFPMAALIARASLDVAGHVSLGHYTHEKSSVGCAAGLATLRVIDEERLLERSASLGALALERLRGLQARIPEVAEVRGAGLLLGVELADPATGAPLRNVAEATLYRCLADGLSFKVGQGNVLVLAPPLTIGEDDLLAALDIVERAVAASVAGAATP
jgi:4-aminobutyrate aminotransferase